MAFSSTDTRRLWAFYAGLVLAVGLLLSVAELQHYLARGGSHPWEPFLWELSSVAIVGPLGVVIYRWHVAGLALHARWRQLARHLLGALVYILAHVSGMFAIRFLVYGLMQLSYEPGDIGQILAYEAGKDLVSYGFVVAICHGLHLSLQAERLRGELAEARLARLAEQVQPHFLFNSLNLISATMYEDVAKADRLLCQLSDLLRQTLKAQQAGWHSLDEELRLVQPFLDLMQARFGGRLRVRVEASAAARGCQLPALLLISPVENAVKHDVAASSAEVELLVTAQLEGQVLLIRVENSGTAPQRTEREGAFGLANLRARVQASFGSGAEVLLAPRTGGGAVLSLRLPLTGRPA
jgi:sensor histidine kinase YesM